MLYIVLPLDLEGCIGVANVHVCGLTLNDIVKFGIKEESFEKLNSGFVVGKFVLLR